MDWKLFWQIYTIAAILNVIPWLINNRRCAPEGEEFILMFFLAAVPGLNLLGALWQCTSLIADEIMVHQYRKDRDGGR